MIPSVAPCMFLSIANAINSKLYFRFWLLRHPTSRIPAVVGRQRFRALLQSPGRRNNRWPQEDQTLLTITGEPMNGLLDGYDLSLMKAHKKLHYEALS